MKRSLLIRFLGCLPFLAAPGCIALTPEEYGELEGSSAAARPGASHGGRVVSASAPVDPQGRLPISSLALPTGDPATSVLLLEWFAPEEVRVGQEFHAEVQVTNLAGVPLENVVVKSSVDENFELTGSVPVAPAVEGGLRTWDLGRLEARETRRIQVRGTARATPLVASRLSAAYDTPMTVRIPVIDPALVVSASGPAEARCCEPIVYEYVVSNTGSGNAREVVLAPALPEGLRLSAGEDPLPREVGTLGGGESRAVLITLEATRGGAFEVAAAANGATGLSAQAPPVQTKVAGPRLEVEASGPEKQYLRKDASYAIWLHNRGDGEASEAVLAVTLPSALGFKSASEGARAEGSSVRWTLGAIAPGDSRAAKLVLTAKELGSFVVPVTAEAACAQAAPAELRATVAGVPALSLELSDEQDPVAVGEQSTYVIEIENQGSADATNLRLKVRLPEGCEFVEASGATGADGAPGESGTLALSALPALAPKRTAIWRVVVRGTKPSDARFRVELLSDQLNSPIEESEATTYYE